MCANDAEVFATSYTNLKFSTYYFYNLKKK